MSGEFLRGVLEENCLFKEFAIYNLEIICPASPGPIINGSVTLKSDRSFLLMAFQAFKAGAGNVVANHLPGQVNSLGANPVELFDPSSSFSFFAPAAVAVLVGGPMNLPLPLLDYPYFEPGGMIGARVYRDDAGTPVVAGDRVTFSLYGIEYAK